MTSEKFAAQSGSLIGWLESRLMGAYSRNTPSAGRTARGTCIASLYAM